MARHKKIFLPSASEPQLEISSMVDICFLLLIYFLVSTTTVRERDLELRLPGENNSGPDIAHIESMFIKVDASGAVYSGTGSGERLLDMDSGNSDLPLLTSQLELYAEAARSAGDKPLVQIMVNNATRQQRVVDVLNALAGSNITAVTFTDILEM